MSSNMPGITRIEGTITDVRVDDNRRKFSLLKNNGDTLIYTVPERMTHMMDGISTGVLVVIYDTASGPKSIVTYPSITEKEEVSSDIHAKSELPVEKEVA